MWIRRLFQEGMRYWRGMACLQSVECSGTNRKHVGTIKDIVSIMQNN